MLMVCHLVLDMFSEEFGRAMVINVKKKNTPNMLWRREFFLPIEKEIKS